MAYIGVGWPDARELASLVRAAQQGSAPEMEALLGRLRPGFVTFFAARLDRDVAEDLAQGATLRVAGALGRIDPERADAYVSTVARNLLRTAYRRRLRDVRRRSEVELSEIPEAQTTASERTEYQELFRAVQRVAEAKLQPVLAEIVLGLLRGETKEEIAQRQGVSVITVRTRLFRARAVLRQELRAYLQPSQIRDDPRRERAESPEDDTHNSSFHAPI